MITKYMFQCIAIKWSLS